MTTAYSLLQQACINQRYGYYTPSNEALAWSECLSYSPDFIDITENGANTDGYLIPWELNVTPNFYDYWCGAYITGIYTGVDYSLAYKTRLFAKFYIDSATPWVSNHQLTMKFSYQDFGAGGIEYCGTSWAINVLSIPSMPETASEADAVSLGESYISISNILSESWTTDEYTFDLSTLSLGTGDIILVLDRFVGANDRPPSYEADDPFIVEAALWIRELKLQYDYSEEPPDPEPELIYGTMSVGDYFSNSSEGEAAFMAYLQALELPAGESGGGPAAV